LRIFAKYSRIVEVVKPVVLASFALAQRLAFYTASGRQSTPPRNGEEVALHICGNAIETSISTP
jgi:hypothetical protein